MGDLTRMTFDVYVEISYDEASSVTIDAVGYVGTFGVNDIPTCTVILPTGYNMADLTASDIYDSELNSPLQLPVRVIASVNTYDDVADPTTPIAARSGDLTLFCGWITGIGYKRTSKGVSLALECTHWLSALTFSSTLSASSHPENPYHFTFNTHAVFGEGGAAVGDFIPVTDTQRNINAANIATDLWGDAILPWFKDLACEDRIAAERFGGADAAVNDSLQGDVAHIFSTPLLKTVAGKELAVKTDVDGDGVDDVDGDHMASAIAEEIGSKVRTPAAARNSYIGLAQTTFWDKLIGTLSPRFFFSVVPRPHDALVIPSMPGGRVDHVFIPASEQISQALQAKQPRAIRAVGLQAGFGTRAGSNMDLDDNIHNPDDPDRMVLGGFYVSGHEQGMVIIKQAPGYASTFVKPSKFVNEVAGIGANLRGNAFNHPGEGEAAAGEDEPKDVKAQQKTLLDGLAHAFYVNEVLKHRWGNIACNFRTDISPGSIISFEGTTGDTSGVDDLGVDEIHYAHVAEVTYAIDAERHHAYSSYKITHVRTSTENLSDDYSIGQHPIYENLWVGADHIIFDEPCPPQPEHPCLE